MKFRLGLSLVFFGFFKMHTLQNTFEIYEQKQVQIQQLPAFILLTQHDGISRCLTNYPSVLCPPRGNSLSLKPCHSVSWLCILPQACLLSDHLPHDHFWPYCTHPVGNPVSVRVCDSQAESQFPTLVLCPLPSLLE